MLPIFSCKRTIFSSKRRASPPTCHLRREKKAGRLLTQEESWSATSAGFSDGRRRLPPEVLSVLGSAWKRGGLNLYNLCSLG